jgi:hypothetical protein
VALSLVVQPLVIKKSECQEEKRSNEYRERREEEFGVKAEAGRTDRGPVDRTTVETPLILEPLMQG